MKRRMLVGGVECSVEFREGQEDEFRRKLSTPFTVFDDYPSSSRSSGKDRKAEVETRSVTDETEQG